jgi:hypothetical protein
MGLLTVSLGTMPIGILYARFRADCLGRPSDSRLVRDKG